MEEDRVNPSTLTGLKAKPEKLLPHNLKLEQEQ